MKFLKVKESIIAEHKRNLRKGNVSVLPNALNSSKCEACNRMHLSKAVYINHNKIWAVGRGNFVWHMCGR